HRTPHLHSFPTRRSSDLLGLVTATSRPPTVRISGASFFATKAKLHHVRGRHEARRSRHAQGARRADHARRGRPAIVPRARVRKRDRKSTRLNSSHLVISY